MPLKRARRRKRWSALTSTLPLVSTIALRSAQLLVLVVVARTAPEGTAAYAVAALGTMTALMVFADAGAANYILALGDTSLGRPAYRRAVSMQLVIACTGGLIGLWLIARRGQETDGWTLAVLLAVGLSQVLEGALKAARAPLLRDGHNTRYSGPELVLSGAKLTVVGIAWLLADIRVLLLLPLAAAIMLVWTYVTVAPTCRAGAETLVAGFAEVAQYGLAGSLSALYSQSPVIVAAVLLPLEQVALLTVVLRIVQSTEVFPATLGMQLLPRVHVRGVDARKAWGAFLGLGAALSTACVLLGPVVRVVFQVAGWNSVVYVLIAAALLPKAGNYALTAVLMGRRGIRLRILVTSSVGVAAVAATTLLAVQYGIVGVAAVALPAELFLGAGLALSLRYLRTRSTLR